MKTVLLVGPVRSRSGYGHHARDIAQAILQSDQYSLSIINTPWGGTPNNALEDTNEEHVKVARCILPSGMQPPKPNIFIQVTIPNEFQPNQGDYNIGITAGIETDVCAPSWIEGVNRMDRVIVPSQHAKTVFENSSFDKIDERTKQKIATVQLNTKVDLDVLFEGVDESVYKKTIDLDPDIKEQLDNISEDFCFLFVGHWLQGSIGEDRKDVGMMIKTFMECFKNTPPSKRPALILKTSGATFSISDREDIVHKIQVIGEMYTNPPSVYLIHGNLTDHQVNSLYNHSKVKAMISFTKGEGFGRPLLEFTTTGKPLMTTNWSGHTDFLHPDFTTLISGELTEIGSSVKNDWFIDGAKWFTIDYARAYAVMRDMVSNYKKYKKKGEAQRKHTLRNFTLSKMNKQFLEILDNIEQPAPTFQHIKLPKLKLKKNE